MQLAEPPPATRGETPARQYPLAHDEYESSYELPTLSPSQKAFAEDPQGFIERLEERAATLFESGYYAYPTGEAHCFAVVHHVIRAGATDAEYFVRPLDGTCTCPFFAWQEKGDYFTEQGDNPTIVPCKHLKGLSRLVRKTRNWLYATGQARAYCALTVPWLDTVFSRWRQSHRLDSIGSDAVYVPSIYRGVLERRKKRRSSPPPDFEKGSIGMKLINTLASVQETLVEANRNTWDALLEPSEITLVQGRVVSPRLYRYEYPTGLTLTPWATGQLCQFLGMPTAYFRRCPPDLQDNQFNHWIEERMEEGVQSEIAKSSSRNSKAPKADRWLLRAKADTLRGVLTERYVRLDHLELFAALSPALSADYEVDWFAVTDESFHLRLHDTRLYRDALPGDRLMAGVHIGNSEVGKRAVTVDALVYRLVCTNGLIRKVGGASLLHQRHIALSRPEFLQSVQQAVHEALAHSAAYLDRLAASVAYPIPNVERSLHKIALDWGLTQATEEAVKQAMLLENPSQHETLYGLINGLTSVARNMAPDERYTLETQAGQLLEERLKDPTGSALVDSASLVVPIRFSDNVANRTNGNGRIAPIARNGEPAQTAQSNQVGLFALP